MPLNSLFLVLLVCIAWAFNFTAGAQGMQHFSPVLFMILRFALVLILVFPFLEIPARSQRLRLVAVCLLIGALHFTIMYWALARSADVSSVVILQQTYIPMAVVLSILLLGERIGWRSLLAISVSFAGVLIIGFDPLVLSQPDVMALALLSAFLQALGSTWMRGINGVSVFGFQAWTALLSLPVLIVVSLLFESGQWEDIRTAGSLHWGSVIYAALVASLVGHGLFYVLVQRHPVTMVTPYMLMTPVLGVVFGTLVWGDHPGWRL
jgi:O-acetylserine/cysteine efflux transporter